MRKTVALALTNDVRIGAHPAIGSGRFRPPFHGLQPAEIHDLLHYRLARWTASAGPGRARAVRQTPWRAVQRLMANPTQLRAVIEAVGR